MNLRSLPIDHIYWVKTKRHNLSAEYVTSIRNVPLPRLLAAEKGYKSIVSLRYQRSLISFIL